MQVVNVIETFNGIPETPISWIVEDIDNRAPEAAESYFKKCCMEHDADEEDIDSHLDDGYYEYGSYEVRLTWSDVRS